jgi:hypothetical protein
VVFSQHPTIITKNDYETCYSSGGRGAFALRFDGGDYSQDASRSR